MKMATKHILSKAIFHQLIASISTKLLYPEQQLVLATFVTERTQLRS